MPLYEYRCDVCGHTFEKIQKFSDPLVDACPRCGGAVHKLMSSPAIQFKGSGWYITDYAKKKAGQKKKAPKADGAKADGTSASTDKSGSGESKSESTPAAKSEAPATAAKDSKTP